MSITTSRDDLDIAGPRERRRRETFEAIVAATMRLAEDREFDDLSVLDICVEADVSISSFYHRFPSKDALLREVHSRYLADIRADMSNRATLVEWHGLSHDELVSVVVREYLAIRQAFAPRFRTMALAEQRHQELATARRWEDHVGIDALGELYASRFPDPRDAAEAKRRVMFIARVVVLVSQDLTAMERNFRLDGQEAFDEIADRLVELAVVYLGENA